jgi:hypothetical protein
MSLRGNPSVAPNVVSANVRRIDDGITLGAFAGVLFGPLTVAGQGRAAFSLNIQQPHPALLIRVQSTMFGATTIDDVWIPAQLGTIEATVVTGEYLIAAEGFFVSVTNSTADGPIDVRCTLSGTTA